MLPRINPQMCALFYPDMIEFKGTTVTVPILYILAYFCKSAYRAILTQFVFELCLG